jgi:hypothetical protein
MDTNRLDSESIFSNRFGAAKDEASLYTRALLELLGDRGPLDVLAELPAWLDRAVRGLSDAQLRRPERAGKWSVIQVAQHLADSEVVCAFRVRLILGSDEPAIQGYDQDRWADALRYADAPLDLVLAEVRVLREANLWLLRGLTTSQWERRGIHSERGPETVRHLTRLMGGHDLLHRRQIDRIKRAIGAG